MSTAISEPCLCFCVCVCVSVCVRARARVGGSVCGPECVDDTSREKERIYRDRDRESCRGVENKERHRQKQRESGECLDSIITGSTPEPRDRKSVV